MKNEIRITGARENNLKNISLAIPKQKITVFTGVSGAGKSSLVFDTIAAEAQRQLNATFTNYLPLAGRPEADSLENLTATVVIDQKPIRGNQRSTVGTITEIYSLLRLLFSRIGEPHIGLSNAFSFNEPEGMCPECNGLGYIVLLDQLKLIDKWKSLKEGGITLPYLNLQWLRYAQLGLFDKDKKLGEYAEKEWEILLHGAPGDAAFPKTEDPILRNYCGLIDTFNRRYIDRDISGLSDETRRAIEWVTTQDVCPLCKGSRLNQRALSSKINGRNIAELSVIEANHLVTFLSKIEDPAGKPIAAAMIDSLTHLIHLGLGYLNLNRQTQTLSAGEAQRIKIVRHLGSSLTDLTYIFDEPTVGLHPCDVQGLNRMLCEFRDLGNTVLVVEHDPDVVAIADHIVDLGPGAGHDGGEIVYQGGFEGLTTSKTLTAQYLHYKKPLKTSYRQPKDWINIRNASKHNLKNITTAFPTGVMTVVTGVAGAGKSSLMEVFLEQHPEALFIDQSPIHTSTRSVTATYTGMMDEIRNLFAQENGVNRSLFSFNSKGACPICNGLGLIEVQLPFMDPVQSTCEACHGKRYKPEVLAYTWRGKSISDALAMTVTQAISFFEGTALTDSLNALKAVGLGYITLGQPLSTYSGGECQRMKLTSILEQSGDIIILDEPTVSLHMGDIAVILELLDRLVDEGNTIIVVEHHLEVIKNADWVIDLGPEGGSKGGDLIFEGTPQQLLQAESSHTASAMQRYL